MSLDVFTLVHVVISLIGIGAGFGVLYGMLYDKWSPTWTLAFLFFTVLTNVTGFMFPFGALLPSHVVAAISLALLAMAIFALYGRSLAGPWGRIYAVTALLALYLNVFVLMAQMFQKMPQLKALAPTGSELAFAVTQGLVLLAFLALIYRAATRFRTSAF
jgi:hypothetical protein